MACLAAEIVCSMAAVQKSTGRSKRLGAGRRPTQVSCCASSGNGAQFGQFLQLDSLDSALQVFRDESKGIVCYRTPTGEITCEGIDEGPHFNPSMDGQKKRMLITELLFNSTKSADEQLVNGAGI